LNILHTLNALIRRYSLTTLCDGEFLRPVFSASRVQHISELHCEFAVKPHHVWKYGRHPISDAENRRGEKKKKKKKKETTAAKYNGLPYWAAIMKSLESQIT